MGEVGKRDLTQPRRFNVSLLGIFGGEKKQWGETASKKEELAWEYNQKNVT
jgi:hypothetical protein